MTRREQLFLKWGCGSTFVIIIAAILTPAHWFSGRRYGDTRRHSCNSNLRQIGLAMIQYSQDNDERLVPLTLNKVASSTTPFKPYGWADGIYLYIKSTQPFQCPSEKLTASTNDATQNGYTDYWMNSNLARTKLETLSSPAQTLLSGDGNDGSEATSARYNLSAIPNTWHNDPNAPAWRHLDRANYLFADGHVKALKVEQISDKSPKQAQYTFAPR